MADPQTKLNDLVSEVDRKVREELLGELQPLLKQLAGTAASIESILLKAGAAKKSSGSAQAEAPAVAKKKPGRPAKKRPGRPAKAATEKAAPAAGGEAQRAPRGALDLAIRAALADGKPKKIAEIRDIVLKDRIFKGREPQGVYTQIAQALSRMADVKKKEKKYSIK